MQDHAGCQKRRCVARKVKQAASVGAKIQLGKTRTIDPAMVEDDFVHIQL